MPLTNTVGRSIRSTFIVAAIRARTVRAVLTLTVMAAAPPLIETRFSVAALKSPLTAMLPQVLITLPAAAMTVPKAATESPLLLLLLMIVRAEVLSTNFNELAEIVLVAASSTTSAVFAAITTALMLTVLSFSIDSIVVGVAAVNADKVNELVLASSISLLLLLLL